MTNEGEGWRAWWSALAGLALFVFAVVALSGPGRIDIVDGQTRYEVARSLVDHGDLVIRDPNVWFFVYPGRGGRSYTTYRWPHSVLGVVAIRLADATGRSTEGRRHFFFTLIGAGACSALAMAYAGFFRRSGMGPRAAIGWAGAGVFCSPSWFYGTSTFDDILGTAALVGAVVVAYLARERRPLVGAMAAGLLLGLALNCKQPLGFYLPVVLAASLDPSKGVRAQVGRVVAILGTVGLGLAAYLGFDWYKYPPGTMAANGDLIKKYVPNWPGNPVAALVSLAVSPGSGVLYYFPPLWLCLKGIRPWWATDRRLCLALLGSSALFVGLIASMIIYKGDPAWGPRYLTPVFALAWLFAPTGAVLVSRRMAVGLLTLGLVVQVAALSVDPHRLYVERKLPSVFYFNEPWIYFHPEVSHLLNRPREVIAILTRPSTRAERFTPSPAPTFAFPVIDVLKQGPADVARYQVLNSFRPWWISQRGLDRPMRPVDLDRTAWLLLAAAGLGLGLAVAGLRRRFSG